MSILYNCPNKGIHPIHQIISNLHHNRTSLSKPFDIIPICGPLSGKNNLIAFSVSKSDFTLFSDINQHKPTFSM